ncbi:putative holin-like toxin [Shouchella lonarensis]|nr:putative holin-like toxin [Shouchella lonarensis]
MSVFQALMLTIASGSLLVAAVGLVVSMITLSQKK